MAWRASSTWLTRSFLTFKVLLTPGQLWSIPQIPAFILGLLRLCLPFEMKSEVSWYPRQLRAQSSLADTQWDQCCWDSQEGRAQVWGMESDGRLLLQCVCSWMTSSYWEGGFFFVSLLTQVYVFQTFKLQVIFYICYWEQMWLIPIGFYWKMTGLQRVKYSVPFNLYYYFLHSVASAGSLCLVMVTFIRFSSLWVPGPGHCWYPSSDSGESQRAAIIGEDPHLALALAPGRLSWKEGWIWGLL